MKKVLGLIFWFAAGWCPADAQRLALWYDKPASVWEASLPLGNGRLGMMPDGGVQHDTIVLNDITLWSGSPQDANNYDAYQSLPAIRKLLFEGKNDEAQRLVDANFICKGPGSAGAQWGCYQTMGNLVLDFSYGRRDSTNFFAGYTRGLSLDSAIAYTAFTVDGVAFRREYFTSFSGDVGVIRITADRPGAVSCALGLNRPERAVVSVEGDVVRMEGQLDNGVDGKGMRYLAKARAVARGGVVRAEDGRLVVRDADELLIYVSMGTDYNDAAYRARVDRLLADAVRTQYAELRRRHVAAFRALFDRVAVRLGGAGRDDLPTDLRLQEYQRDQGADNGLAALFFQYGRYLSISSTRVGLLPPNLQGLWANEVHTPWNGDYHLDVNVEMNHWPVDVANLSELDLPLADLVARMVPNGERSAKAYYHAGGWVAHVITNPWHFTEPGESASWGATKSGSGWLCNNLWQHFAFTGDTAYLRRIYPILRGAALFYHDMLIRDPETGWLVTSPSSSPENWFALANGRKASICMGPTIDNQIVRELYQHVIRASFLLKTDNVFRDTLAGQLPQLPPPGRVAPDGRMMEWLQNYAETEVHHRHISHLYGLYPGDEITPDSTPDLAAACAKTLDVRGDDGPSWSIAYKMLMWARLYNGQRAYKLFKTLMRPTLATNMNYGAGGGIYPNLFSAGPPFQIDANFGGEAAIAELLLQSHAGYINLLPAIPEEWKASGEVRGLKARGDVIVDLRWKEGRVTAYRLYSAVSRWVLVKVNGTVRKVRTGDAWVSELTMPRIFGDGMVLQRDAPVRIWGHAGVGETVVVSFHGQVGKAVADSVGLWKAVLAPMAYGGPYPLEIRGRGDTVRFKDVLVGDVWVCSGQSNMEFPISGWTRVNNADEEIRNADYLSIRLFSVDKAISVRPEEDVKGGRWQHCDPGTIAPFSAVGYFFGRELYKTLKIPIGLINTTWGGTDIESWISRESLDSSREFHDAVARLPMLSQDSVRAHLIEGNGGFGPNSYPSLLFNAMVNPLRSIRIKGAIWYQGENNAVRAWQYRKAMPLLIEDWRHQWDEGSFPLYFVQLTSFKASNGNSNSGSTWAELRESQALTQSLPNTGMAVTIDIGDPNNIHPTDKQDVGRRLAALALHGTYGQQGVAGGPAYSAMSVVAGKALVVFSGIGGGLVIKGTSLLGFEVAGEDRHFYPANAAIEGNRVVLSSDKVTQPVAVRYGWEDDASDANLFNVEGYPACPFRTDDWPAVTREVKYGIEVGK